MKPIKPTTKRNLKARRAVETEADPTDRAHTLRQIAVLERIAVALENLSEPQGQPALDALTERLKTARTKLAAAIATNTPEE